MKCMHLFTFSAIISQTQINHSHFQHLTLLFNNYKNFTFFLSLFSLFAFCAGVPTIFCSFCFQWPIEREFFKWLAQSFYMVPFLPAISTYEFKHPTFNTKRTAYSFQSRRMRKRERERIRIMAILVKRFNECTAHKNVLNDGSSNRAKSLKNLRHLQKKAQITYEFRSFFLTRLEFKCKTIEEFCHFIYVFESLRMPFNLAHSFAVDWILYIKYIFIYIWENLFEEKKNQLTLNINHVKNSEKEWKLLK